MSSKREKSIKLIAAVSDNDVIGLENGELPWVLPGDLAHFKKLTTGNTIVMGWNTWQSIGEKPLPNRMNIVISRKKRKFPRSKWVKQITNAFDIFTLPKNKRPGEIFIIGGGQVYSTYLPIVNDLYLTFVHINVPYEEKCIKFPHINWAGWAEVEHSEEFIAQDGTSYEFRHYVRT